MRVAKNRKNRQEQKPVYRKAKQQPTPTGDVVAYQVRIDVLSPVHLGSGKADVNVDMEVTRDRYGMPCFPAKRLRGLLYESALEVAEMSALSDKFLSETTVDELFGHAPKTPVQMSIHDFVLENEEKYQKMRDSWSYLMEKWPDVFCAEEVLRSYASVRFYTSIDPKTGLAVDTSLRNMRVVNKNLVFRGTIVLTGSKERHRKALFLAVTNLRRAGLRRNRGLGHIRCTIENADMTLEEACAKEEA